MQHSLPSRRQFVSSTSTAIAGAALAPAVLRSQSKTDRPTSAVIGVGGRGNGIAQTAMDYSDVLALCDVNEKSAANIARAPKFREKLPRVLTDFRRVLDDKAIDAVFIATPHHWHTPIAVRAPTHPPPPGRSLDRAPL